MEELIELLDKYQNKCVLQPYNEHNLIEHWSCRVISKEWGFIKWLVENDKIDISKLEDNNDYLVMKENWANTYKALLMLLSIQDKPIEFLISILK